MTILKYIYNNFVRPSEMKKRSKIINSLNVKSVLDVGASDGLLFYYLNPNLIYAGIDIEPKDEIVVKSDIMKLNCEKFDLVCCFAVLEHTKDPVKVMKKLKDLSNKYIMISVPYEPYYTISRFFVQEKEHFWTIYSSIIKYYLGEPILERHIHLGREYMALYDIQK